MQMKRDVLAKAVWDRWWLIYVYSLITVIAAVQVMFTSGIITGIAALAACALCYIGPAGFIGSFRARQENNYSGKELVGIGVIAVGLTGAGLVIMVWSGFWLMFFGIAIKGVYWALAGSCIALMATKKEDVQ